MKKISIILSIILSQHLFAKEIDYQMHTDGYDTIIQIDNFTKKELDMLNCVQFREDSNSELGAYATIHVVLNRVKSKKFPNTIEGVLQQRGQFPWVRKLSPFCKNSDIKDFMKKNTITAVMLGEDITNGSLFFHKKKTKNRMKIGSHYFGKKF